MADIGLKLMISLLYVIQGMFFFYIFSLPLSYRSVPSYYIIGLFGSASIPFSFKFLFGKNSFKQLHWSKDTTIRSMEKEKHGL